jgi:hypothetical protein
MNYELIKSIGLKLLPILTGALIGGGVLDDATGAQLPKAIDSVIVLVAFIPTAIRSLKNYWANRKA